MYTKVGKKLHKTSARKKKRGQCTTALSFKKVLCFRKAFYFIAGEV